MFLPQYTVCVAGLTLVAWKIQVILDFVFSLYKNADLDWPLGPRTMIDAQVSPRTQILLR